MSEYILSSTSPWDFMAHFPSPLSQAVDAGKIEADADGIASIFTEHTHEVVAILREIMHLRESRKLGLDPRTGKKPSTRAKPIEWAKLIRAGWRDFRSSIAIITDVFGDGAARAFKRFCVALAEGTFIVEIGSDTLNPPCEIDNIAGDESPRAAEVAFFDSHCPAVWIPGQRTWNSDKLGRYRVSHRTGYEPDHPFYYHEAGPPIPPAEVVDQAGAIVVNDLGDYLFGTRKQRDFASLFAQYRDRLAESLTRYASLYEHGPRGLSDQAKTFGRYGKTPMTVWGETMALLHRQVSHFAAVMTAIESHLAKDQARLQAIGIGGQMPLFG